MAADNRLVAKNTIYLYLRMLATIFVGLYTYRLVIAALGLEDYGIFGIVGDIVAVLYVLNDALGVSSSRFITFALGEGDKTKARDTFVTVLTIHLLFAILLIVLGELVGIWYINHKALIPPERLLSAQIVFQLSLLTSAINLTQVPFTAVIIAHERMSIYAWLAIIDSVVKLLIAFALTLWGGDRLVFYGLLLLAQSFLTTLILRIFCLRKFDECVMRLGIRKGMFKKIARFVGWNMLQNVIFALNNQGLTLLIAAFFSPIVIAARAIAVKILLTTTQFIGNFRQAMNPQIIKLYANGEYREYRQMVLNSARFSFYIFWIIALPVLLNTDTLLELWLGQIPEYASVFIKLSMIDTLFWLFDASFNQGIIATGDIKRNTLWTCVIDIARFPLLYLLLRMGFGPVCVYALSILSGAFIGLYVRPHVLRLQASFEIRDFLPVFFRCLVVTLVSLILPLTIYPVTHQALTGLGSLLAGGMTAVVSAICSVFYVGMDKATREKAFVLVTNKLLRRK